MVACSDTRGALLVFEGVDRSGKSTQSQRLVQRLLDEGVSAELWRFPDRTTTTGQMIDSYLQNKSELDDAAVHLLFSANRWEKRQAMLSKLQQGTTLVLDRYSFSGAVFTAAKRIPGLDLEWTKAPERGLPAPDKVLFLDLDPVAASKRGGFGGERYENRDMQTEVRDLYHVMSKEVAGWITLDAGLPIDELHDKIYRLAKQEIERCSAGEAVSVLW